jgi:thiol-disulfide isomerase/thioredoxin
MKQNIIYGAIIALSFSCSTIRTPVVNNKVTDAEGRQMLLGHCSISSLQDSPYKTWFDTNYANYTVDTKTADELKTFLHDKTIVVFMGTWCGDSRREVPRLIKMLEYVNLPADQLELVMVDYREGAYKQSPQHQEKGKQIFRVPTMLVFAGNKEINRVVESPKESLEKDLLAIASGQSYEPNYAAGKWYLEQVEKTSVKNLYSDSASIAKQIKPNLKNAYELNSIARVLFDRNETEKSIFTFLLNEQLYPASVNCCNALADAYIKTGEKGKAAEQLQKARQLDANNEETNRLSKLLE